MARIYPFRPYRYSRQAGPPANLLTQPYDKITPEMQERYLRLSPYNLVRIELGPRSAADNERDNVYTRAGALLEQWIASGILVREPQPAIFPYWQEFQVPDSAERAVRQGFIALGALEEYAAGVVYRHEQTLTAPKQDRMELLKSTRAHTGQIFMLYPDPENAVEQVLEGATAGEPWLEVEDEYGVLHRLWRVTQAETIAAVQRLMADKKLLIADGHHRYETALAFYREHPELPGADRAMMTFVNLYCPGLKILATHRLLNGLPNFRSEALLAQARGSFAVRQLESLEALRAVFAVAAPEQARIGLLAADSPHFWLLERPRGGRLALEILHQEVLEKMLGIDEEAVRRQTHLSYVRGLEEAAAAVRRGEAQAAFLVEPVAIAEVARVAFSGGLMPQKSTDFYPKLLSGLTIYRLGE